MEITIRNNKLLASRITLAGRSGSAFIEKIRRHAVEVPLKECSSADVGYRMTESLVAPVNDGAGNEVKVYLWANDTTVAITF